jgi:predicted nucleic acid-binding Zn ribbon protein
LKKLVSNCSFQLKGTGWYVTDYARKSETTEGKKEAKKKDTTEKQKSTTTEKKESQGTAVNQ